MACSSWGAASPPPRCRLTVASAAAKRAATSHRPSRANSATAAEASMAQPRGGSDRVSPEPGEPSLSRAQGRAMSISPSRANRTTAAVGRAGSGPLPVTPSAPRLSSHLFVRPLRSVIGRGRRLKCRMAAGQRPGWTARPLPTADCAWRLREAARGRFRPRFGIPGHSRQGGRSDADAHPSPLSWCDRRLGQGPRKRTPCWPFPCTERELVSPGRRIRTTTCGASLSHQLAKSWGGALRRRGRSEARPSGKKVPQWIGMAIRGESIAAARAARSGSRCPGPRFGPHPQTGSRARSSLWASAAMPSKRSVSPGK